MDALEEDSHSELSDIAEVDEEDELMRSQERFPPQGNQRNQVLITPPRTHSVYYSCVYIYY